MTADDLSAPLGQQPSKRRRRLPFGLQHVIAGALALFLVVFVLGAIVGDNQFGGEPMVAVPVNLHPLAAMKKPGAAGALHAAVDSQSAPRYDGPASVSPPPAQGPPIQGASGNAKTVTIINGKTGAREEVPIPAPATRAGGVPESAPIDQKFVEMTPQGPIPKIAADGVRPAEAFAQPVTPLPGKPDAPRIALIVAGLGVSANATAEAIATLPGPVTLALLPYGADIDHLAARARAAGHEILLQVPMEPFDYPDKDPGPQTLLTSFTPQQNLERLHALMSRFQGYVGLTAEMGARFTSSEQSFAPVLRETARRGLIFVDDDSNPRSVAGRIAGANNLPFAQADIVLDSVPTPVEIDQALGRLEMAARERGVAVGISSALPVSIEHIAKWAKAAESRGLLLVPITAVALKAKQS